MPINALIQGLSILSGLAVNFAIPLVFGLEQYGLFIKANILVFVVHKMMDAINEPLLNNFNAREILQFGLIFSGSILLGFSGLSFFFEMGSVFLLGSMLLSSVVLLSVYSHKNLNWVMQFLLLFICCFGALVFGSQIWGGMSIKMILALSSLIPSSLFATKLVFGKLAEPRRHSVWQAFGILKINAPRLLSYSLVSNFFVNIFPFLLSKILVPADLGFLRVVTSVVQSVSSLFPVSTRVILLMLSSVANKSSQVRIFFATSLLYFSVAGICALILEIFFSQIGPYLKIVPIAPVLFWTIILERYLIVTNNNKYLSLVNIILFSIFVIVSFVVRDVEAAIIYYSVGFSIYCLTLWVTSRLDFSRFAVMGFIALCPAIVIFSHQSLLLIVAYFIVGIIISTSVIRFNLNELKSLRG